MTFGKKSAPAGVQPGDVLAEGTVCLVNPEGSAVMLGRALAEGEVCPEKHQLFMFGERRVAMADITAWHPLTVLHDKRG